MIDIQQIDLNSLPSVPLAEKKSLPTATGIYFAIDSLGNVQYIGKAGGKTGLNGRWAGHHRYEQLNAISEVRIAYLTVGDSSILDDIETALIEWFDPPLNVLGRPRCYPMGVESKAPEVIVGGGGIKWDLRAVMARQNVTQTQLAKEMGVNRSTVKTWHDKDTLPTFRDTEKTLNRLCKVLRCKLSDLMFYVEDETE